MNSFYSIVYIHPNSLTAEKYAVGLLLGNNQSLFFDYKPDKLSLLDKLFPSLNLKSGVLQSLKNMKHHIQQLNKDYQGKSGLIFSELNHLLDSSYTSYLHHYSKGMIQFSEVNPVAADTDIKLFSKLFEQFITGEPVKQHHHSKTFHQAFKKKINSLKIQGKVDLDYKLTPSKLDGIYSDTQVRLIGKNGGITAIQDIDFTINMETLGNQLNQWEILVGALNSLSKSKNWKNGDYHVVFNKPLPRSAQEKLLNSIVKQKSVLFKVDSENEVDELLQKIEKNDYQPISTLING